MRWVLIAAAAVGASYLTYLYGRKSGMLDQQDWDKKNPGSTKLADGSEMNPDDARDSVHSTNLRMISRSAFEDLIKQRAPHA